MNLIEGIFGALKNRDWTGSYYGLCSLEQALSDAPREIVEKLPQGRLIELRHHILGLAKSSMKKEECILSDGLVLCVERIASELAEKVELLFPRTCESLSHFGSYPNDFGIQDPLIDESSVVIGVRSAGSYFAPFFTASNGMEKYYTLRIKGDGGVSTDTLETGLLAVIRNAKTVYVVDEGPGTGKTFRETAIFIRDNNEAAQIVLVHNRPLQGVRGHSRTIYAGKKTIDEVMRSMTSNEQGLEIHGTLSLRGYESPKVQTGAAVLKFIGYGPIGESRYNDLVQLQEFYPEVLSYSDGVALFKYVDGVTDRPNDMHLREIGRYFEAWSRLHPKRDIDNQSYLQQIQKLAGVKYGVISDFANSINITHVLVEPDWKLEREKWRFGKERIYKFDPFHFGDFADSPLADPVLMIAGIAVEFDLKDDDVTMIYSSTDPHLFQREKRNFLLNKVYYLLWKNYFYGYIADNLMSYAFNREHLLEHRSGLERKLNEAISLLAS
ncbi:hypothetical protein HYW20_06565 [Candidatus Woesearchaeota archaeon]|nr:hypothetical protein [Candidatus Woesearchaeota archaeon]